MGCLVIQNAGFSLFAGIATWILSFVFAALALAVHWCVDKISDRTFNARRSNMGPKENTGQMSAMSGPKNAAAPTQLSSKKT